MQLQQIFIYPIKSTQGYETPVSIVKRPGLCFDREFMLTELDGSFITARKEEKLLHFRALPMTAGIQVFYQDQSIKIYYQDFQQQATCQVWQDQFPSRVAPYFVNKWFSEKLQRDVQLRWMGPDSVRYTKRVTYAPVSFADGYPLLLTTQQSLQSVQQHCPIEVQMKRFRPNIVIDGVEPFAELHWNKIQIGEVIFKNIKPCERCVLITRHPDDHQLDSKMEPLRTLKKYFTDEEGNPIFGIHLIPLNTGVIRRGDPVKILA